jgi:Alpha amylase, catalytic domain
MAVHDLWYKNAILDCLDVEKYMDANGDGTGDFEGLHRPIEYLAGLGVTCLWLQPFYPSPNRDNGYDRSDFYGVHPKHGTPGDFVPARSTPGSLQRAAPARGMAPEILEPLGCDEETGR